MHVRTWSRSRRVPSATLRPSFDPRTPTNVSAVAGKAAYLSCRVRNIGNSTVSANQGWSRANVEMVGVNL